MRRTETFTWPAPSMGWVTAGNITSAPVQAAERLDNFFPTAEGAELRRGYTLHATLDAAAVRFIPYVASTTALFACTDSDIYEIASPADAEVTPTASLTGLASGDWSSVQFGTSGGSYAVAVNGSDHAIYYDGTTLLPLVGEAVISLAYDALSASFNVGETVSGGTSGASAEILGIAPSSETEGTLYIGAITSGPFQNNETITDGSGGSATSNIPSGTSTASSITITGVDTDTLSHVWRFAERMFFIEKDTLSAWYLPVDSIGGAASEIFFGSIFAEGGSLIFGATWSIDSGAGLGDKCVFVTDQGEVAVYNGTDPSSASTWALEGLYKIPPPIDKHAYFQFGGELMIVTDAGIIPLSLTISRRKEEVIAGAYSANIEDQWQEVVAQRSSATPVTSTVWHSRGMLIVSAPTTLDGKAVCFVANTRTGAWCRYLGWQVNSSVIFNDQLYFADATGLVNEADTGGTDGGTSYTAYYVPKFSELGSPNQKTANHVGLVCRSTVDPVYTVKMFKNYEHGSIPPPNGLPEVMGGALWGSGEWGTSIWGGGADKKGYTKWKTAGATGFSLSPGIAMTSGNAAAVDLEIAATIVRFEIGNVL